MGALETASSSANLTILRFSRKEALSKGGVITVVIKIMAIMLENNSLERYFDCKPILAMIKPTSPREIIPMPNCSDSRGENYEIQAPSPAPAIFPITAMAVIARIIHNEFRLTWCKSTLNPILTKKIGTKNEYASECRLFSM